MAVKKKQKNIFAQYFSEFGLRQICDMLIIIGAIVLIVGLCTVQVVITIGLGIYLAACLIALYRSTMVLLSKINKRSPEYKRAIVNTIIMGVLAVITIITMIFSILD